jgi:hypothetical protein
MGWPAQRPVGVDPEVRLAVATQARRAVAFHQQLLAERTQRLLVKRLARFQIADPKPTWSITRCSPRCCADPVAGQHRAGPGAGSCGRNRHPPARIRSLPTRALPVGPASRHTIALTTPATALLDITRLPNDSGNREELSLPIVLGVTSRGVCRGRRPSCGVGRPALHADGLLVVCLQARVREPRPRRPRADAGCGACHWPRGGGGSA